jgi:hypothetical protein
VKDFLEEITQRPFGDNGWGYQYQERLERVVLYGDATTDEEFLKTLNLVVGSKLPETQGLDPVYAVAVGAAQAAYFAAGEWFYMMHPKTLCTWLPGLGLYIDADADIRRWL